MRTEKFNSALLSTLIVVSLMAPAVSILLVLTAGQVSAQYDPENIVSTSENAYSYTPDQTGDPSWLLYVEGDRPPIMIAKDIEGGGKVVAASIANALRNGYWNGGIDGIVNPDNHLDELLHAAFQWMVSGATKVIWYEGYEVYADTTRCSDMIDALTAKGYSIITTENAFENIVNLASYDILILPSLQLGDAGTGGDPDQLPDSEVAVIKSFVDGDKGLLVAEGSDYFVMQFYKVQNKILKAFDFGMYFQSDQVIDDVNNYGPQPAWNWMLTVDVDDTHPIGSAYKTATDKTIIGIPSVCSLAPLPTYAVTVTISPDYMEGLPGGTLKYYTVKVTNMGSLEDSYTLDNTDNSGWGLTLSQSSLLNVPGFFNFREVTLKVDVPGIAVPGTVDNITVTATGSGTPNSYDSLAIAGRQIRPTMDDAQVVKGEPDRTAGATGFMYVGSSTTGRYKDENAFLKFDLQGIASSGDITSNNARLFLYGFLVSGTPDKNVELYSVENDTWVEENINWNDAPNLENSLGLKAVPEGAYWYSWDVTSFVQQEFGSDQIASFGIAPETEGNAYPDNFSYGFDTKEFSSWAHPRIAIGSNVWVTIDPEYREGLPGGTLKYTVNVWNMGSQTDTYDLTASDNAGWSPTVLPSSLSLSAGEKGTATLSVTIPENAVICVDNDNITVTATLQGDTTVKNDAWTIAHPAKRVKPAMPDTTTKAGINLGLPPTIWGIDDTISVGRYAGGPERGWLRFDLRAIPYLENIERARLNLHTSSAFGLETSTGTVLNDGVIVQVYSVANDTWIEDENWTSTPPIDSYLDTRAVTKADTCYSWDVTDFVRQEFQSDKEASFALVHLGENIDTFNNAAGFISRDDWGAENKWPYLEILCTAQLPTREVRTSISPIFQGGVGLETTLTYTVTVKNTGTDPDSYVLDNSDTKNWDLSISPSTLSLEAGESGNATLSVTILSGEVCTLDRITVTATSENDNTVNDSAIAFAHLSEATIGLENLYKIGIDLNIRLREDADKLVAKFYTLGDDNEGEGVVWENIMPWYLDEPKEVPHPWGQVAVKKVRLVLVDETDAEWLVASFTLNRDALFGRIMGIKGEWPLPGSDRNALFQEIMDIKGYWPIV